MPKGHMHNMQSVCSVSFVLTNQSFLTDLSILTDWSVLTNQSFLTDWSFLDRLEFLDTWSTLIANIQYQLWRIMGGGGLWVVYLD